MEKYLFEREWKEAVLIRKDNKSTVLVIDGEEMEICCPKIVRGNITEGECHVLSLKAGIQRMENMKSWHFHWIIPKWEIKTGFA